MKDTTYRRVRSGEVCVEAGWYGFDGYVDGPPDPLPPLKELEVLVVGGEMFPLIDTVKRACYWELVDLIDRYQRRRRRLSTGSMATGSTKH